MNYLTINQMDHPYHYEIHARHQKPEVIDQLASILSQCWGPKETAAEIVNACGNELYGMFGVCPGCYKNDIIALLQWREDCDYCAADAVCDELRSIERWEVANGIRGGSCAHYDDDTDTWVGNAR